MSTALEELLLHRATLYAAQAPGPSVMGLSTGYSQLDAVLPEGGWRLGALTEIIHSGASGEELQLVLPALAHLSRTNRWLACIAPPQLPQLAMLAAHGVEVSRLLLVHPRAGADGLRTVERALRLGTCGAVLAWPECGDPGTLQQLQHTALTSGAWGVLFRRARSAPATSPLALRLQVTTGNDGLTVDVLQRDTDKTRTSLRLPLPGARHITPPAVSTLMH